MIEDSELKLLAARMTLGRLSPVTIRETATRALVAGETSPTLGVLALSEASDALACGELMTRWLAEKRVEPPDRAMAVLLLARQIACEIQSGEISPRAGSTAIAGLALELEQVPVVLHDFLYADSEWDVEPEDTPFLVTGIGEAAERLCLTDDELEGVAQELAKRGGGHTRKGKSG
jgi:hypothetical protein